MTQTTRVPEFVTGLVAIANDMKTHGIVDTVLDGPRPKGATKNSVGLAIAVTDTAVATTLALMDGFNAQRYSEKIEVTCNAWSWSGGTDPEPHRVRVADVHRAFMDAIRDDEHMGSLCQQVVMGARTIWTPQTDAQGCSYFLAFTIVGLVFL